MWQLKQDVLGGRLPIADQMAVNLSALVLQCAPPRLRSSGQRSAIALALDAHSALLMRMCVARARVRAAELGSYDEELHTPALVSEFHFVPESMQSEQFELAVLEHFKTLRCATATSASHRAAVDLSIQSIQSKHSRADSSYSYSYSYCRHSRP